VLLVLAAGARLSGYIGATVGEIGFLRGFWMDGSRRLAWLEDYAASIAAAGERCLDHVPYPGTSRVARRADVAGGRGTRSSRKTTLVKLLAKMYEPSSGSILVDDTPLARLPAGRVAGASGGRVPGFLPLRIPRRAHGRFGRCPRMDDRAAVAAAVDRAGAGDVVERLPGARHPARSHVAGGVELSFGQWQKLALARGFMRDQPLLLILDEPTAALDAETEHALFERYAAAARGTGTSTSGRITILVSHRFSTVRMADLIVVLDGARLVEVGTHDELMAKGGQYAELYGIQAAAYR
jgi:ATP-binding cassette subfamily B protein